MRVVVCTRVCVPACRLPELECYLNLVATTRWDRYEPRSRRTGGAVG